MTLPPATYTGKVWNDDIEIADGAYTFTDCTWHSLYALNCTGRITACHGRNVGDNFVQLDKCHDFGIGFCDVINAPGITRTEDIISVYQSVHCMVANNWLQGATPSPSFSGSGIMLDDGCKMCWVCDNVVSDTQNAGIGIAGGWGNTVSGNRVGACGSQGCNGNVGIYSSNRYPGKPFGGHVVRMNRVCWATKMGRNDYWINEGAKDDRNKSLPVWDVAKEYADWQARMKGAKR